MHFVYIIYSESANQYYIGESSDPALRLNQHNIAFFKGSFTSKNNDWRILLKIPFKNAGNAKRAEFFIKKMKSRKFLEKLILSHDWLVERFDVGN